MIARAQNIFFVSNTSKSCDCQRCVGWDGHVPVGEEYHELECIDHPPEEFKRGAEQDVESEVTRGDRVCSTISGIHRRLDSFSSAGVYLAR